MLTETAGSRQPVRPGQPPLLHFDLLVAVDTEELNIGREFMSKPDVGEMVEMHFISGTATLFTDPAAGGDYLRLEFAPGFRFNVPFIFGG
jgi:hypothetical protein